MPVIPDPVRELLEIFDNEMRTVIEFNYSEQAVEELKVSHQRRFWELVETQAGTLDTLPEAVRLHMRHRAETMNQNYMNYSQAYFLYTVMADAAEVAYQAGNESVPVTV